jgi:hypothetical protein
MAGVTSAATAGATAAAPAAAIESVTGVSIVDVALAGLGEACIGVHTGWAADAGGRVAATAAASQAAIATMTATNDENATALRAVGQGE